ncbi:aminotransferase class IV [Prosthecomicrobium sp. N25]|uniref:aminotransferase class IV n=1 Tax=Prosthecomicrobium sp. N25 TaxID=3129254 RepID=UPI003077CDE7
MAGSQDFASDPRNAAVKIYLNGDLVAREDARVSVFDAGFVLGDGVWEGFRLHKGTVVFADRHFDRLYAGARAIDMDVGLPKAALAAELDRMLAANGMRDGVHIRLMVTRGLKKTPNQDPRHTISKATIVIVAEYKQPSPELASTGLSLFTSTVRCSPPDMFDMRLNSHSRLNLIQALIQAIKAGADEALMLDPNGFVSSCNATNFFFVKDGEVRTSRGGYCFNGITRAHVIELCERHGIPVRLADFTLAEVYDAEEAFVTGTFGGLTPVRRIDGRDFAGGLPGPMTARLRRHYGDLMDEAAGVVSV